MDRIEREITIAAPVDRVWSLVVQAGFWLGEENGATYPVRLVSADEPRYVAYRWASVFPGEEPGEGNSTLVEFTLEPEGEGTRLRVVESGFASLNGSESLRRKGFEDNSEGWVEELDALRKRAESG